MDVAHLVGGLRVGATYSLGDAGDTLYFSTVQYGAEEHSKVSLDSTSKGSIFVLGLKMPKLAALRFRSLSCLRRLLSR